MNSQEIIDKLTSQFFGGLEECFKIHTFDALNNIDLAILCEALLFYLHKVQYTGGVFIDVGTNGGSFVKTLLLTSIKDLKIHCFEPHPVLSKKTKEFYPFIYMNEYCLSNKNGVVDFYIPKWNVELCSMFYRPHFDTLDQEIVKLTVPAKTLDSYCAENNITNIEFLKIDVEGAEKLVFEGALHLLQQKKIKCGMFEVGSTLQDANTSESEIISLLESYGYVVNTTFHKFNYMFYLHNT